MRKNVKNVPHSISGLYKQNWWVVGLRGVFSIIFGSIALFMPVVTVLSMTLVFGVYTIVEGILKIISGVNLRREGLHWGSLLAGILSVIVGLTVLITPHISTVALSLFLWTMISIWAVVTGATEITMAVQLRQEIKNEWLLALSGLLNVVLGIGMFMIPWFNPLATIVSLGWLIGFNAFFSGVILVMLAFKLKKLNVNEEDYNVDIIQI